MTVWTISAQTGSGGEQIARVLAERAGVPLVDPCAMVEAAGTDDCRTRIRRVAGWLTDAGATAGSMFVASASLRTLESEASDPRELMDSLVLDAARTASVILDWSAFAVLRDHPAACHVRIQAPLKWRARQYARENCLPERVCEQVLRRLERERSSLLQWRQGRVPYASENFALVCDSSRLHLADLVELLLIAGGRTV